LNKTLLLLLFLFLPFLCLAGLFDQPTGPAAPKVKANTLIFKLKPDYAWATPSAKQKLQELLLPVAPHILKQKFPNAIGHPFLKPGQVDLTLFYELQFGAPFTFTKLKGLLLSSKLVEYVEPVYIPELLHQPNDPLADSLQGAQYYLRNMKAFKGWDIQKGDSTMVIGILDTGIRLNHQDLKSKIKYNYADPINGIDDDKDGYIDNFQGWDLADNDNNPSTDKNTHGALVSGIAAGAANNGVGVAGVGYNTKILPIKVFNSTAKGSFAGYEAIVYAADHGCQVINISWGSPGFSSAYEQELINYAVINKNVVVVAAGGNTAADLDFYPASYDNVISVSSVDGNDNRFYSHTYSNKIDILAVGVNVWTTGGDSDTQYSYGHGTSFATPIISGCAALIRKQFPEYTALQVAEQLRITADDIYNRPENIPFKERLGRGRVNLYRALSEKNNKAVRNTGNKFSKGNSLFPGDTLKITGTFTNFLAPAANLEVTLSCASPYVTILQDKFKAGALATLASATNTQLPFKIFISPTIPLNTVLNFRYGFSDGSYTDYQYFKMAANPDFLTINVNNLGVTITSKGNIGYNGLNYEQGDGVFYKKGNPLLAEGGLMIGATPNRVSDNIRNERYESDNNFTQLAPVQYLPEPGFADVIAHGVMQDSFPTANTAGVRVSHWAYAWKEAPNHKFVILEYKITNNTLSPLNNLYAGMFTDWDIDGSFRNVADWDSANAMGYVYNVDRRNLYVGVKLLSELAPTHYAIDNLYGAVENISLADGFSNTKKYRALSNPTAKNKKAGLNGLGNDVSDVTGAKMPNLAPGESATIAFAIVAGDNFADLVANAANAQAKFKQVKTGPLPVVLGDTICPGANTVVYPENGKNFKFYADANRQKVITSGRSFTTPPLKDKTTYYVTNIDSTYESAAVPFTIDIAKSTAAFSFGPNPVSPAVNGEVTFTDYTPNATSWHWYFGDKSESTAKNPTVKYRETGHYTVKLVTTNATGCTDSLTQIVKINYLDYSNNWQQAGIKVYPNPTPEKLNVDIPANINLTNGVILEVVNLVGEVVRRQDITSTGLHTLLLPGLAKGLYILHIKGKDGVFRQKFQYL
jgi:serine protease